MEQIKFGVRRKLYNKNQKEVVEESKEREKEEFFKKEGINPRINGIT